MTFNVDSPKINVLIIGTGMYVSGRGTNGFGTILPSIVQSHIEGYVGDISVASKHKSSFVEFDKQFGALQASMGTDFTYRPYPLDRDVDSLSYRKAILDLKDPGAVIIAVPDHLHYETVLAAIESRKHVFVVKPLVPTVPEAHQLIQATDAAGVYGAVDFHKRWDLANLKLRQAIENRAIGDILYFHVEFSQRKIIPTTIFSSWVNETSIFQYLGVHYADLIYFVTQKRPIRVLAIGQKKWLIKNDISTYDAIEVLIEWEGGFTSTILTNWIDPDRNAAMSHQMIKVIGTFGRVESDQTDRGVHLVTDSEGLEIVNPYFCQPYMNNDSGFTEYKGYGIESILQFLKDVQSVVAGQKNPRDFEGVRPTFRSSLVSTAIVEAAHMSLKQNNVWIRFDDNLQPHL